jgi:hypothetical protein
MFLTSCFYVLIALISLYLINKLKEKPQRRTYTRAKILEQQKIAEFPKDWSPMPTIQPKVSINPQKEESLESFILKEIENSVKELEQKRVPFSNLDNNVLSNRLNPTVQEFLPKISLNPLAQDFYPY